MNQIADPRWQHLLALAGPAFTGDAEPPYGFTTRLVARLHAEETRSELIERIGLRALLAALILTAVTATFLLGADYVDRGDLEPGLRGFLQVEDISLS